MTVEVREIDDRVDVEAVARLRWRWVAESRDPGQDTDTFVSGFVGWWLEQPSIIGAIALDTDAAEDDAVVGMAFLMVVNRVPAPPELDRTSGDVQSVYVVPDSRGHGVGTRLLELLVDRARERGCIRITVHSSSRALPYYERLGFQHNPRVLAHPLSP